jgi:hypothetical protein
MLDAAVSTSSLWSVLCLPTFLSRDSGALSGSISLIIARSLGENL